MRSRDTSKQRSARIPLDYFKQSDPIGRWKVRLAIIAAGVALVWLSGIGFDVSGRSRWSERSKQLASRGPLNKVHAAWETDCEACHVPFRPIDGSHWSTRLTGAVHDSDRTCRACHEGPAHHRNEARNDVGSCASCHREHRGRESHLISDNDRDCTKCHEALDRHLASGESTKFETKVVGFSPDSHPEFALLRGNRPRDPGHIKFNHALHMTKGLTGGANGKHLKTPADLPPESRARYRGASQDDSAPIQLRCDSCHVPNADGSSSAGLMRPIRFETDCRACHPLDFAPELPAVRHGMQPSEVRAALWEIFASRFVREHPNLPAGGTTRPIPGREDRPEVKAAREAIERDVEKAEKVLFSGNKCGECHEFVDRAGSLVDGSTVRSALIRPANIPSHWLPRAKFDHAAHRNSDCKDCHAAASPDVGNASKTAADVLIPGLATCVKCHAPKTREGGGAGYSCTECHRYHDGDSRLIGRSPEPARSLGSIRETDESVLALGRWARSK